MAQRVVFTVPQEWISAHYKRDDKPLYDLPAHVKRYSQDFTVFCVHKNTVEIVVHSDMELEQIKHIIYSYLRNGYGEIGWDTLKYAVMED